MDVDALYEDAVHAWHRAQNDGKPFALPVHDGSEWRQFTAADVLCIRERPAMPCPWMVPA